MIANIINDDSIGNTVSYTINTFLFRWNRGTFSNFIDSNIEKIIGEINNPIIIDIHNKNLVK